MRNRSFGTSVLLLAMVVTAMVALRAADDKGKGKGDQEEGEIVKFSAAPAAVQKTFKEDVKAGKIELLGKGINDKNITFYKATVGLNGMNYEVAVGADGVLLEKILQMTTSDAKIDDCPPPVTKTLKEEAKGAKVEGVEKVAEGKRIHYVIDVAMQRLKYQLIITDDGTLLSKIIDYDKDDLPAPTEAKSGGSGSSKR
jgi:hypothetical protein